MGLAGTKVKQRFGLDPRNTAWSNDTSRFGHKQLEKLGWAPGQGLGRSPHLSQTSHIKVSLKDDTVGLGAKIKRSQRKDEFDSGECAGLDVFQRILGRLNGKEEEISNELDTQRKEKIINGKWGIHFVKTETLASTWDPKTKKLRNYSNNQKRSRDESEESDDESFSSSQIKKHKSTKKSKKEKKHKSKEGKKHKKEDKLKSKEKSDKSSKKDKADKKLKKNKSDEKDKSKKKDKKKSKEKKHKHSKSNSDEEVSRTVTPTSITPTSTGSNTPSSLTTRLSVRSRWIKQKRAATMDSKALNEIFMVTNS